MANMRNLLLDPMLMRQHLETVKNRNLKLRYAGNLVEYLLEQDNHHHGFNNR